MTATTARNVAGVDGCRAGWVAVTARPNASFEAMVFRTFEMLVEALPDDSVIAVDMPIGLPETCRGGRGPEALVRPLLGARRSSVFSIRARSAVYACDMLQFPLLEWSAAHRRASQIARRTSDPSRGISIQAFGLFAKIRQIDMLLRSRPELRDRIFESHPEVAFWRLNGGAAMQLPKKIKNKINAAGMEERKLLLAGVGVPRPFLDRPPRGAGDDDFLDATAMCLVAARIARGEAKPFPEPPLVDGFGIPIAIWC